ncbi:hypothetical protein Val02_36660 [Virgisporangium aliadipatigenens]|uniref:Ricin B lectin domain-containing protein n=1 Tax=Virgisporangium aliadipatigenens TaxID=741659 RepID=A0A8J4DQ87_9ACTN|nr:ricin-type beta-trefoil lectin domain protein [Virgisporangium aliadipatigenens]GIJ46780.1 hypothetical protein Val02_36660 [Virgisporangium aliadipatigenens]
MRHTPLWLSRRLDAMHSGTRRKVAAGLVAGAVLCAVAATTIGLNVANAENDDLTGASVSDELLATITSAARSCLMLTPARVAGQLMAESGLDNSARSTASGGEGIAGMDNADWKQWSPWPNASRSDQSANVLALAHQMCDLSGQLRVAKVQGDPWRLSLAAYRAGLKKVTAADAPKADGNDYVEKAAGYAAYYGKLPQFGNPDARQTNTGTPTEVKPIPDQFVAPVVEAGKACQQVTSAAVAAVVMAASGFNANMLGDSGQQGIAQFRTDVWKQYAPEGATAWNATTAIPVVGKALCGMMTEFTTLQGDPYSLALAGFHQGPTAVRQAGGTIDAATKAYLEKIASYTSYYALDTRIGGTGQAPPSPGTSPSPSGGTSPSPKQSPTAGPKTSTGAPPPPPAPLAGVSLVQDYTGKCLDAQQATDGVYVVIKPCSSGNAAQRWDIRNDGTIRSVLTGLCLDVAWAATNNGAPIQTANCSGNPAQQWKRDYDDIISVNASKCADTANDDKGDGTPVQIQQCVGNTQQKWRSRK